MIDERYKTEEDLIGGGFRRMIDRLGVEGQLRFYSKGIFRASYDIKTSEVDIWMVR